MKNMPEDLKQKLKTHEQIRLMLSKGTLNNIKHNVPDNMTLSDFIDELIKLSLANKHYVNWIKNNK